MRHRLLGAVGVGALALVTAGTPMLGAAAAPRSNPTGPQATYSQPAPPSAGRTCYTQRDADAFSGIISQNFDPAFDAYDAQAADDFVLTKPCRRPILNIDGSYGEGAGVADSFNVTIYRATKHGPGKVERHLVGLSYSDPCGTGCAQIVLHRKLAAGHWWLSVQANLSFSQTGTQWQWWTNLTVRHTAARWKNPGDGFGTGCTTYTDLITCVGDDVGMGGDLSFSLTSG